MLTSHRDGRHRPLGLLKPDAPGLPQPGATTRPILTRSSPDRRVSPRAAYSAHPADSASQIMPFRPLLQSSKGQEPDLRGCACRLVCATQ